MSLVETARKPTFRLALNFTSIAGTNAEISNPPGSGVVMRLRRFNTYSGATCGVTVSRRTLASTGGTSTNVTPTPARSTGAASLMTVKNFTINPTPAGALLDTPLIIGLGTAAYISENLDSQDIDPITLQPGEVLNVSINAATAFVGNVVWTEETS
jgi:hypothetical protein